MASIEEHRELAVECSDRRDDEASSAGSVVGPDMAEGSDKALGEVKEVSEKTSEGVAEEEPDATAAVAPGHPPGGCSKGVVEDEKEGAVEGPQPTPQSHSSEDISRDLLEAHSAVPITKKYPNSRSVDPSEGDLDFEDDARPGSASSTSLFGSVPDNETKEEDDKLEEGETDTDGEVSDISEVVDLSDTELAAEDDLEEGELPEGPEGSSGSGCGSSAPQRICRFFNKGQCTWGSSCRFRHPGINDRGSYNMFDSGPEPQQHHHMPLPMGGKPVCVMWGIPPPDFPGFLGPPMPPMVPDDMLLPPIVSAWERGLQHAKELKKRASRRKEQEPDFEEKRLNLVPSCHDQTSTQDEMDKVDDFSKLSAVPLPFQGAYISHIRPPMPPPVLPRSYRRGRRGDDRREELYGSGYSHGPRPFRSHWGRSERDLRWHEECFPDAPPPPMARSRPDEWRDPWRRSKTPQGHRRRSKGRNRRSPSHCSSRSFSSRSSKSSYSYSRSSSSPSSYSTYDSRSKSRSPAAHAPTERPRGNQPKPRRSPPYPYASPSQALAKQAGRSRPTRATGGPIVGRSPALYRRKSYKPSPPPVTTPSPHRKSRRHVTTSSSSRTPSRSRSQSFSRSPSLTTVSSASSSPIHHQTPAPASAAKTQWARPRNPWPRKKMPERFKERGEKDVLHKGSSELTAPSPPRAVELAPTVIMPTHHEPLQPTLDLCGFEEKQDQVQSREALLGPQGLNARPQIKLTLIKKTLPLALPKTEVFAGKNTADKGPFMLGAKKRPASPKSPSPPPSDQKPLASRREELLKQLKAVEDAIARKRARFS